MRYWAPVPILYSLDMGALKLICKYLIFHEDAPHVCQMFNITIILFNLTGNLEGQEIWRVDSWLDLVAFGATLWVCDGQVKKKKGASMYYTPEENRTPTPI